MELKQNGGSRGFTSVADGDGLELMVVICRPYSFVDVLLSFAVFLIILCSLFFVPAASAIQN